MLWDMNGELKRMSSLAGIVLLLLLGFVFSKNRNRISWGPVVGCIAATFLAGLVLLRFDLGAPLANCAVSKLRSYVSWLTAGGRFAFGYLAQGANRSRRLTNVTPVVRDGIVDIPPVFAFSVLPSLCYMAALLRILYYVGFMQACLGNIHHYVNVGPSFNSYEVLIALLSAVNGPVESMLLVHPYLLTMSRSSLHCILTLDCGTVSGRLMPVYVDLGWLVEMAYRPLVLLMGVSWRDSHAVAQLLAIKVFLNEYVALTAFVKTAHNLEARTPTPGLWGV
ncbi:solute carrier family 28 member 3-like isoform X3 [Dermacentor andersoni]|uniref:solute carrier family 28 member 3-like isoform X3 n=1 Tax=Dermacentor andersoni TaxID=34620 RepID=UPI0024176EBD|nr:solute carrier family 28 member 3-like isoform X3 [Dermacentor andersoni]